MTSGSGVEPGAGRALRACACAGDAETTRRTKRHGGVGGSGGTCVPSGARPYTQRIRRRKPRKTTKAAWGTRKAGRGSIHAEPTDCRRTRWAKTVIPVVIFIQLPVANQVHHPAATPPRRDHSHKIDNAVKRGLKPEVPTQTYSASEQPGGTPSTASASNYTHAKQKTGMCACGSDSQTGRSVQAGQRRLTEAPPARTLHLETSH